MSTLHSITIIYLIGFICLFQAGVHFLVLNSSKDLSQRSWIAYSVLMGLGLIWLVGVQSETERYFPVFAFFLILVAQLARFIALSNSLGKVIQRKPLLISIAGIFSMIFLYKWSLYLGAPLGSLETIALLPLAASSCITAWYVRSLSQQQNFFSMTWMSRILWVEAAVYVCLALGALAGAGQDYIDLNSSVILSLSLITLLLNLGIYMLWLVHCGEKYPQVFKIVDQQKTSRKISRQTAVDQQATDVNVLVKKSRSKTKTETHLTDASESTLTTKELDVLKLVVQDKKNKDIADVLGISEASVKVHKSRMTSKLGVKGVPELKQALEKILSLAATPAATLVAKSGSSEVGLNLQADSTVAVASSAS